MDISEEMALQFENQFNGDNRMKFVNQRIDLPFHLGKKFDMNAMPFHHRAIFKAVECKYAFDFIGRDWKYILREHGFQDFTEHFYLRNYMRLLKVTGVRKIKAVVGGFHLKHQSLQLKKTIACLKEKRISRLFPSHCTGLPALAAFYVEYKIKQLKSGMILDF